jgi:hypothetical protein
LAVVLVTVIGFLAGASDRPGGVGAGMFGFSPTGGIVAGAIALACTFVGGVKLLAVHIARNVRAQRYKV